MLSVNEIVSQIKQAVRVADSTPNKPEQKLRELVSPIWENFLKETRVGLSLQIRDELTLAYGRADTVFNRLILEYKKPYTIKSDNNKNRQLLIRSFVKPHYTLAEPSITWLHQEAMWLYL